MRFDLTTTEGVLAYMAFLKANPTKSMIRSATNGRLSKQDLDRRNGVPESQFLYRRA